MVLHVLAGALYSYALHLSLLCKANMLALQLQPHLHVRSADNIEGA